MMSLTEIMNRLPPARRKRIEERAATILADEYEMLKKVARHKAPDHQKAD